MKRYIINLAVAAMMLTGCTETTDSLDRSEVLSLSTEEISMSCEGGSAPVEIYSLFPCEIDKGGADWITTSAYKGVVGASKLTISCAKNETTTNRTASLTIGSERYGVSRNIVVNQEAFVPELEVSQDELTVSSDGATTTITVSSNIPWSISGVASWIAVSPTSSTKEKTTLTIKVSANSSTGSRTTGITIKNTDYNINRTIQVTQKPFEPMIAISAEELTISAAGGERSITIDSNISWAVSDNASWITLSPSSSSGGTNKILTITAGAYTNQNSPRRATIVVANSQYNITKTIAVTQEQLYAIRYTSTDGAVVKPNAESAFDANIISNTYSNGQGILAFDKAITTIGKSAFEGCTTLKTITIPQGVTSLGDYLFYNCTSLTEATLPASVTTMHSYVFGFCSSLTSVNIPSNITGIRWGTFFQCDALSSITLHNRIKEIESYAFSSCSSLTEIAIPNSVTKIGTDAFYDCDALTSVTIPNSVVQIEEGAFSCCNKLAAFYGKFATSDNKGLVVDGVFNAYTPACTDTSYTVPNGVTTIGKSAFWGCTKLTSVTIPNGVTTINRLAFERCSKLTSVEMGNSVTDIAGNAFAYCSSLQSITIPRSVTSIGEMAFYTCNSLASIYCEALTPPTLGANALNHNASDRLIYVPTSSLEAYKGATGWSAYSSSIVADTSRIYYTSTDGNIVTPNVPSGATPIVSNVYACGYGIITFDGEVTNDNMYYAFNGRSTLKTISIPSGVTRISEGSFYRCEGLTSVTLPDSVTEISSAFTQCPSLTAFYSKWASPDKRCLIINGTLWAFAPAGLTKYAIPSGVTLIGYRVFSHCEHLTSITIPDSVISIGAEVFSNCTSLTEVTIPAGVTRIGAYAFHYCTSLSKVICKPTTPPTAVPAITITSSSWSAFGTNASDRKIYVPTASLEAYKTAKGWSDYADYIEGTTF